MMIRRFLLAGVILGLASAFGAEEKRVLDIPPRLQWDANYGYCGETSLISAGLYYGQYCSQYRARAIAAPRIPQNNPNSQLLLGVNAGKAAAAMHLQAIEWKTATQKTTEQFLAWVKQQILSGRPVIIGLFMNEFRFYGEKNRNAGDPDYDHIVPVTGISSAQPLTKADQYFPTDTILYQDNGLWAPGGIPPFEFRSSFAEFARNRAAANAPASPVYSLNNNRRNYGIAITGVKDLRGDTIPVRLSTSVDDEVPAIREGSSTAPKPQTLGLTATVQIPNQTVAYNLYLYNDFASVPDSQFNANAAKAARVWRIPAGSGQKFTAKLNILSSDVAVFRAVPAKAP